MKSRYSILLLLIVALCSFSFLVDTGKGIRHDQHDALKWSDFQARASRASSFAAKTSSGYVYNASLVGDSMRIVIPCLFYPKKSWYKKDKASKELLKHEQGHFDITELHVRKMRREIAQGKFTIKNFNKKVTAIIKKYSRQSDKAQDDYDHQTDHSIIVDQQEKWNKKIETELMESQQWADPIVMVKIKL